MMACVCRGRQAGWRCFTAQQQAAALGRHNGTRCPCSLQRNTADPAAGSHSKGKHTWPSSPPPTVTSGRRKAMRAASAARPQASIRLP